MKKSDSDLLKNSKFNHLDYSGSNFEECSEHKELKKDKKYINKLEQIFCHHDKNFPLQLLIVITLREKDCSIHIAEIYK